MTIWFDMDGTIADLYSVENWLPMLRAYDPSPYALAKPLVRLSTLAYMLNKLRAKGYRVGVISWGSKCSTPAYDAAVTAAKMAWLKRHLPSVDFDEIHVVPYGVPKQNFKRTDADILFDDEERNRTNWGENAHTEAEIFEILKSLA
jgi:hypothetical protein